MWEEIWYNDYARYLLLTNSAILIRTFVDMFLFFLSFTASFRAFNPAS